MARCWNHLHRAPSKRNPLSRPQNPTHPAPNRIAEIIPETGGGKSLPQPVICLDSLLQHPCALLTAQNRDAHFLKSRNRPCVIRVNMGQQHPTQVGTFQAVLLHIAQQFARVLMESAIHQVDIPSIRQCVYITVPLRRKAHAAASDQIYMF